MAAGISNSLTPEEQIQILQDHINHDLLNSLGGAQNILKTIPQNNNFSHPTDHQLAEWYKKTEVNYEKIDPNHPTEISISRNWVIFIFKRCFESLSHLDHSIKTPSTATLFLFGNKLGNWVFSPFLSKDDLFRGRVWRPQLDRPYMETLPVKNSLVELVKDPDKPFLSHIQCTEKDERAEIAMTGLAVMKSNPPKANGTVQSLSTNNNGTSISNTLTDQEKIELIKSHIPLALRLQLRGAKRMLERIPQNNNFVHPNDHFLAQWYKNTQIDYETINPQNPTEISISRSFVIFILLRPYEGSRYNDHNINIPSAVTLFLFGNNLGNWVFSPFVPKSLRESFTGGFNPSIDRPYLERSRSIHDFVQLHKNTQLPFASQIEHTAQHEKHEIAMARFQTELSKEELEFNALLYSILADLRKNQ